MTYFGQTTYTASQASGVTACGENETTYVCPGSGPQNVKELSVYCSYVSSPGNIRLGVYNSAGTTLIGQGNAEKAITDTLAWKGHMTPYECSNMQLVGGTSYRLFASIDTNINYGYAAGSYGAYKLTDYTGGLPAAIPAKDGDLGVNIAIRCGVDPPAFLKSINWWDQSQTVGGKVCC